MAGRDELGNTVVAGGIALQAHVKQYLRDRDDAAVFAAAVVDRSNGTFQIEFSLKHACDFQVRNPDPSQGCAAAVGHTQPCKLPRATQSREHLLVGRRSCEVSSWFVVNQAETFSLCGHVSRAEVAVAGAAPGGHPDGGRRVQHADT